MVGAEVDAHSESIADVRVRGVDGCRGGWLAVDVDLRSGAVAWQWWPLAQTAAVLHDGEVAVTAIDIPIGLPATGRRACDVAARARLGRRGVSVFPAPLRAVLGCPSYAEARAVLASLGGPSMSAQAFGIVAAVAAVDAVVSPADDGRLVEAHPEVAFAAMGDGPVLAGKRTAAGVATRLRLLAAWRPDVLDVLAGVPAEAPLDDALDALACAWVAGRVRRGEHETLGDSGRDDRGLPTRIVV
jgi:predicted RNase H-like nuclease